MCYLFANEMLVFLLGLLVLRNADALLFAVQSKHVLIECGRAVIIKNHYWFLARFVELLKASRTDDRALEQHIPFEQLHSVFQQILVHCQAAHDMYRTRKSTDDVQKLLRWFKARLSR